MSEYSIDKMQLADALQSACGWLINIAQVQSDQLPDDTNDDHGYAYSSWSGAIRSEYHVEKKQWDFMGPIWHTGQALKALLLAAEVVDHPGHMRDAAQKSLDFILRHQVWDESHADHGLILAYENDGDKVGTSAILECMHGMMLIADHMQSPEIWQRIIAAGQFVIDHAYIKDEGRFYDVYDPATQAVVVPNPFRTRDGAAGRPLLDDGIFAKLYEKTRAEQFLDVHLRVSQTLLEDQNPAGNWIDYAPCDPRVGRIHPRQHYWWSLPLIDTFHLTGQKQYLDVTIETGRFCEKAMRTDGGWFRGLYLDFRTESFGHATSGSACTAILWLELFRETGDVCWLKLAERALGYCLRMQFTSAADPNLGGAILEKILPPDGTDGSPYHIRDLGTIFFIIAAVEWLKLVGS